MNMNTAAFLFATLRCSLAALSGAALTCCETNHESSPAASTQTPEGTWSLAQLGNKAVPAVQEAKLPTLTIADDGKISGSAGVNRFSSALLDPAGLFRGEFKLSPIASTRMAGPPEAMKLEIDYLNALGEADGYRIESNTLVLTKAGNVLMTLTRSK